METQTTTSFKDPINEKVSVLPSNPVTGYRVVLTSDPDKVYHFNGTDWETDTNIIPGTMARLIGKDSSLNDLISYFNRMSGSEIVTPFFPGGGTMVSTHILMWQGSVYIIRNDGTNSDIIRYNPETHDSDPVYSIASKIITSWCIDSFDNLWLGTSVGLYKIDGTDVFVKDFLYTSSNSTLPFDYIDRVVADGARVWLVNNQSNDWSIAKLDTGVFTDLTARFYTDTTLVEGSAGNRTFYDICTEDGKVFFTLKGAGTWSGRLFYYNEATELFANIALYNTLEPNTIAVVNGILYAIPGAEGRIYISIINTGTTPVAGDILYTSEADKLGKYFRVNGENVYAINDTKIYALASTLDSFAEYTDLDVAIKAAISPYDLLDIAFYDSYVLALHETSVPAYMAVIVSKEYGWDTFPRNGISTDDIRRGRLTGADCPSDGDTIAFASALGESVTGDDWEYITLKAIDSSGDEVASGWKDKTNTGSKITLAGTATTVIYFAMKIF